MERAENEPNIDLFKSIFSAAKNQSDEPSHTSINETTNFLYRINFCKLFCFPFHFLLILYVYIYI